jgi:hypothetical protein
VMVSDTLCFFFAVAGPWSWAGGQNQHASLSTVVATLLSISC